MKTYFSFLFIILYFNIYSQSGLVSGNYSVATIPTNNGNGTFDISGTFSDPKGQYFASDVDSGMVFWKGNHFYLIDSILNVNGSDLDIRVQDTYSSGFIPTGAAQIVELTPNLALPGVSTTGDSNPALATPPDYAALMNYLIQRIDNVFGGSGLDLDSLIDVRLVGENLELELVSGQTLSQSLSSLDFTAWRTLGALKQNDPTGFAYRTGNTTIGVLDSNTHKFRVDGTFQFNPESGFVFDFQGAGPVPHKSLVLSSDLDNLSGTWPPANGANYSFLKNSIATDRDLLGSISFLGLDDLGNLYNGGGIDVFADGNWVNGAGLGTSVNIWTTSPTETFARNVATFKGDGRLELDRYFSFDDGNPYAIAGFSNDGNDLTRHPINGSIPTDTAMILFDPINDHYFWSDLATTIGGGSDNLGNHIATQNIQLSGNYLSNDGGNEGILISNDGKVSIGTTTFGGQTLRVDGGAFFTGSPTLFQVSNLSLNLNSSPFWWYLDQNSSNGALRFKDNNAITQLQFSQDGRFSTHSVLPTSEVDIGDAVNPDDQLRLRDAFAPSSSADAAGNTGNIVWNDNYICVKTTTGWKCTELEEIFASGGPVNRTISADATYQDSDTGALISMEDITDDADFTTYPLPAAPIDGQKIRFICISSLATDVDDGCQISRNGNNINGSATDVTIDTQFQEFTMEFHTSDNTWYFYQ